MTYAQMKAVETAVKHYEHKKNVIFQDLYDRARGDRFDFENAIGLTRQALIELGHDVLKAVRDGRRNSDGPAPCNNEAKKSSHFHDQECDCGS